MNTAAQTVARNSIFQLGAEIVLKLLSFGYMVLVVRQLGDAGFGKYSTAFAFVGILSIFADMGMAGYAIREIGKDRTRAAEYFANMIVLRLLLSVGVLILNVALAILLGYEAEMVWFIGLASLSLLLYAVQGPIAVTLRGLERMDHVSIQSVVNRIAFISAGGLFLWLGWGVTGAILATFVGIVAQAVLGWHSLRAIADLPFRITPRIWMPLIRAGIPFGLITFATMLSFKIDTVMLSLWRTHAEVGWYNIAYNLVFALLSLTSSFNTTLVPTLTRQYQTDPSGVQTFYLRTMRMLWIMSLPIAVGTALLSHQLIVLIYGSDVAPAADALAILIWVLPAITLTSLCGAISTVLHRERASARVALINASFNFMLNLWAVPRYGIVGAATMTVATEVLGLVQFTFLLRDTFSLKLIWSVFRPPLLAAAVMGGVVWFASGLPVLLVIPLGALVYAGMLLLSGGITLTEIRDLAGTIGGVFQRRPSVGTP